MTHDEIMPRRFGAMLPIEPGWLEQQKAREAEARAWVADIKAKVRDGRLDELTPEQRGRILAALEADCPEA